MYLRSIKLGTEEKRNSPGETGETPFVVPGTGDTGEAAPFVVPAAINNIITVYTRIALYGNPSQS